MRQRSRPEDKFAEVDSLLGSETRAEPLDEAEQEAVIREFEALSLNDYKKWRLVFGCGALAAGIFFMYAAWRQIVEPFGVRYTGELRAAVRADVATAMLVLQGGSLLASAWGLLSSKLPPPGQREAAGGCLPFEARQRAALWGAVGGAAVGAVGWAAVLLRSVQLHGRQLGAHWELTWLPAGPLAGCLMCAHVATMLADTEREIQRLRGFRYRFKKL